MSFIFKLKMYSIEIFSLREDVNSKILIIIVVWLYIKVIATDFVSRL
jgi:hypothetical protein